MASSRNRSDSVDSTSSDYTLPNFSSSSNPSSNVSSPDALLNSSASSSSSSSHPSHLQADLSNPNRRASTFEDPHVAPTFHHSNHHELSTRTGSISINFHEKDHEEVAHPHLTAMQLAAIRAKEAEALKSATANNYSNHEPQPTEPTPGSPGQPGSIKEGEKEGETISTVDGEKEEGSKTESSEANSFSLTQFHTFSFLTSLSVTDVVIFLWFILPFLPTLLFLYFVSSTLNLSLLNWVPSPLATILSKEQLLITAGIQAVLSDARGLVSAISSGKGSQPHLKAD